MTVHFVTFSSFNKLSVCRETAAHITKVCPYAKVWACFLDSDPGVSQAALSFASIRSWWTKTVKAPTSQHLRLLSLLTTSPRTYGLKKKLTNLSDQASHSGDPARIELSAPPLGFQGPLSFWFICTSELHFRLGFLFVFQYCKFSTY